MTNRSVFPSGGIDNFQEHHEILASDISNIQRYQQLVTQVTRTPAEESELSNLKTTLIDKIFSSEDLNKLQDCITNIEDYFLNKVLADILANTDTGILRTDVGYPANLITTDRSSLTSALNEVKLEANTNGTNLTNHTTNTSNPHNVTASQVGAYTTSQIDTKVTSLDAKPYFRMNMTTSQNYNTTGVNQQITFTSSSVPLSSGFTTGTNVITCNTDGIYKLHFGMQLSGLNQNILASLIINVTINGATTTYFRTIRGALGWDGANGGGVWIDVDEVIALPVGATIQFYANVGESVRTVMGLVGNVHKISKNTVGV